MDIFSDTRSRSLSGAPAAVTAIEAMAGEITRPAAVVSQGGIVRHLNHAARDLARAWPQLVEGRHLWSQPTELLDGPVRGGGTSGVQSRLRPFALCSGPIDGILFAQPLRFTTRGCDVDYLVLITAFSNGPLADLTVLRVLGLTPAEARLSVLIATGLTVAEAANELGVKSNTACSTLKLVYHKLGIRKQSEIARLIAFVQALSV